MTIPRFVSLRHNVVNVRRGPDRAHRVDWKYTRRGLPLMVIAEFKDWRQTCDREGATGWIHVSQLSGRRTAMVLAEKFVLRLNRSNTARPVATAERGAILVLETCRGAWCLVRADAVLGWAPRTHIWGVFAPGIRK